MGTFVGTTTPKVSALMSRIRGRDNKSTEGKFLEILRRKKIHGWRRHVKMLGTPDFVFPKQRAVIFLDGCFWHGCPTCYREPKTNSPFWANKITRNRARDLSTASKLKGEGWRVLRIWECSLDDEKAVTMKVLRLVTYDH
jgi:DNA mismatch endonuclease (patch repair protein)